MSAEKPRKRRRWLIGTLVVMLVLVVVLAVVANIVLHSDLPRSLAVDAVQQSTGLRVEAASLDTGWFGSTTLRDVKVGLPLESDNFLELDELHLEHTSLLKIVLTGSVSLEEMSLSGPTLRVREAADGTWNVAQAATLVTAALGDSSSGGGSPAMAVPRVELTDATIQLSRADGRTITYSDVKASVTPRGAITADFTFDAGSSLHLDGSFLAGSTWWHRVHVKSGDLEQLIDLFADAPGPIRVDGNWEGQLVGSDIEGRLTLADLTAATSLVSGEADVTAGNRVTVRPVGLVVSDQRLPAPLKLTGGELRLEGDTIAIDKLAGEAMGTKAVVTAQFNADTETGTAKLRWHGNIVEHAIEHSGQLDVDLDAPSVGRRVLNASLRSDGHLDAGSWSGIATVHAAGPSLTNLDINVRVADATWRTPAETVAFDPLAAEMQLRHPELRLLSATLPGAESSSAKGTFNVDTQAWQAELAVTQFRQLPWLADAVDVTASGSGTPDSIDTATIDVAHPLGKANANFSYQPARETPLVARFEVTHNQRVAGANGASATAAASTAALTEPRANGAANGDASPDAFETLDAAPLSFAADWRVAGDATGTVTPLKLNVVAAVTGKAMQLGDQTLDDLTIPFRSTVALDQVEVKTTPFDFFRGKWRFDTAWRADTSEVAVTMSVEALPLSRVISFMRWPLDADGRFDAKMTATIPLAEGAERWRLAGGWTLSDLTGPQLGTNQASGKIQMRRGVMRFDEVTLRQGDASIAGSVLFNLRERHRLRLRITADRWPVRLAASETADEAGEAPVTPDEAADAEAGATDPTTEQVVEAAADPHVDRTPMAIITGDTRLIVDVLAKPIVADGWFNFGSELSAGDQALGTLTAKGNVAGRTLTVDEFGGTLVGGAVDGQFTLDVDKPFESRGNLGVKGVDLERLATLVPQLGAAEGQVDAAVKVEVANEKRAPGPVRVALSIAPSQEELPLRIKGVDVGSGHAVGYIYRHNGIIVEDASLNVAKGTATVWLRSVMHGDDRYLHVKLGLDAIELDQLIRALTADAPKIEGLLGGNVSAIGYINAPHRMGGRSQLTLSKSDLGDIDVFGALLGELGIGSSEPKGTGKVTLKLDGERLIIERLGYFNRPLDATGFLIIERVFDGTDSPVRGQAVGSLRPLKDTDWSVFDSIDTALNSLQQGAAAVDIRGTLGEREIKVVPLPGIGVTMRELITGEVEEE